MPPQITRNRLGVQIRYLHTRRTLVQRLKKCKKTKFQSFGVNGFCQMTAVFFTQITASISRDTLKHIIGISGKQSTKAPETVTVRKNDFASPPRSAPGSLNLSLVWSSLVVFLFYFQHLDKASGVRTRGFWGSNPPPLTI